MSASALHAYTNPLANHALENTFGTLGAVCWSVQLVPQIWKSWRRKDTAGLSAAMMAIWFVSGVFLGAYVILQDLAIPLIIQPQLFSLFAVIAYAQCLHYDQRNSKKVAITVVVVASLLAGGMEAALIFGARAALKTGNSKVVTACGVLSAVFIVAGLLPQYWEIYKLKCVVGISLIFLAVDAIGGVMSTLSLVFAEGEFDILACCSYAAVVVLELGVFLLVPILNPAHRRRIEAQRRNDEESLAGVTACSTSAMSEVEKPDAVAEKRGRSTTVSGPLGWMDPAVRVVEEEKEAAEVVSRPASAERKA